MNDLKQRLLPPLLVFGGIAMLSAYPLSIVWPSGWHWGVEGEHYFHMLLAVYATLGVFLLLAAKAPEAHRSLLQFTAWSSIAHGLLMTAQSFTLAQHGHLLGDVAAMLGLGLGILVLMPPKSSA